MVDKDTLKKIFFLKDLPDHVLEKIGKIAQIRTYEKDQILYHQDENQNVVFMLVDGLVSLNSRSQKGLSMTLDEVTPGRIFGVPALLNDACGAFTAVCAKPCTMIALSAPKMRDLFDEDFEIGHIFMRKMVEMYKSRREMHTKQFVHSLKTHPEIKRFAEY